MTDTTAGEGVRKERARKWICDRFKHNQPDEITVTRLAEYEACLAAQPSAGTQGEATHPTGAVVQDAFIAGFLHGVGRNTWDDMHDYAAVCAVDYANGIPLPDRRTPAQRDTGDVAALREAVDPSDMEIIEAWIDDGEPSHCVPSGRIKSLWQSVRAALSKPNAPGAA